MWVDFYSVRGIFCLELVKFLFGVGGTFLCVSGIILGEG